MRRQSDRYYMKGGMAFAGFELGPADDVHVDF